MYLYYLLMTGLHYLIFLCQLLAKHFWVDSICGSTFMVMNEFCQRLIDGTTTFNKMNSMNILNYIEYIKRSPKKLFHLTDGGVFVVGFRVSMLEIVTTKNISETYILYEICPKSIIFPRWRYFSSYVWWYSSK